MSKRNSTLLWSFHKPEGSMNYLLGTMHVQDEYAFYMEKGLVKYIEKSSAFAAELDLDKLTAMGQDLQKMRSPKPLSALLTKSQLSTLDRCCRKYLGAPAMAFNYMYPMLLVQLFTSVILGRERPVSLDRTLWDMAESSNKTSYGLETIEEQLSDFHAIPLLQQKRSLLQVVRNFNRYRKQLKKLLEYYRAGDLRKLYQTTKKSLGKSRSHLLYKRNERLAERMVTIERQEALFAAVGAAHLWGEFGVIRLLKLRGYAVQPIRLNLSPNGDH